MARNAEKAMTTLARWRAAQVQEAGGQRERRPYLASDCNDLPQAEKWRLQIVREIAKKVAQIQNVMDQQIISDLEDQQLQDIEDPSYPIPKNIQSPVGVQSPINIRSPVKGQSPIQIQSPIKVQSPVQIQSPNKILSPIQIQSPNKGQSPIQIQSPLKVHSPMKVQSPMKVLSPMKVQSPIKVQSPLKVQSPIKIESPMKERSPVKGLSPVTILIASPAKCQSPVNHSDNPQDLQQIYESLESAVKDAIGEGSVTNKIQNITKTLTEEANALKESIKSLSNNITESKQDVCKCVDDDDINFPYHLFLIEIIINKIHMKCECFDIDYNNLVISATFLGKQPIVLYDSSYGKIDNFHKLNVGKSTLFAMTYDTICCVKDFVIHLSLKKQPPCSSCVTKIGETRMDYTKEFATLREELCTKWREQQPTDNILCTTSTPLTKNMYYLSCGTGENSDTVGIIEVTVRMSFLGKEINTAFCAQPKSHGPYLLKDRCGMTMYSCQNVEMDDHGKILLDECVMAKKQSPSSQKYYSRSISPCSFDSSLVSKHTYERCNTNNQQQVIQHHDYNKRYDEIYTKMNVNELKIRVPKTTRVERMGKYDKIQELCDCESTPYNTGEQVQIDLPNDYPYPEKTYTSNMKYTLKGLERSDKKNKKLINITPSNCPVPVNMAKIVDPQKDVFILKIGKKLETKDKKTDLEIELITPKAPSDKHTEGNKTISAQCSDTESKKQMKLKGKKVKGGKAKKGKGGKAGKGKKGKSGKAKKTKA